MRAQVSGALLEEYEEKLLEQPRLSPAVLGYRSG
jgi:hypothetical protein